MWLENGLPVSMAQNHDIGAKRFMITVTWSRFGIKSIQKLPNVKVLIVIFFSYVVLDGLKEEISTKDRYYYCDHAHSHLVPSKFKSLRLKRLGHQPYSPDLTPKDLFLLGLLKKLPK